MKYVIKLIISYNGTHFYGWQRQQGKRTVQGVIEYNLSELFKKKIQIDGAGRTDRGVHAYGQVATFTVETTIPKDKIGLLINRRMPADIHVTSTEVVDESFHARYSAKGKRYAYKIHHGASKDPLYCDTHLHVDRQLNVTIMKDVSKCLIGEKDFRSFMASGSNVTHTIREIYDITFIEEGQLLTIEFYGNGFLYNMIRILVGLLLDVEAGKIGLNRIEEIIKSKDRTQLKHTAPPEGLYLVEVYY